MTAAVVVFDTSKEYYDLYKPLRAQLLRIVERCYPVLRGLGDEFHNYLRKAPELGIEIVKNSHQAENSLFLNPGPDVTCTFCGAPLCAGLPQIDQKPMFGSVGDGSGRVKYFCGRSACFRKITVGGCFRQN
ncbi:hypothetical protein diail_6617 [Diaporthe ilicicola]|nr:hypothetical protein diail_6617 [Diaporthe ilicicola]